MSATVGIGVLAGLVYSLIGPKSDALLFSVLGGVLAAGAFEAVLLLIEWIDFLHNRRLLVATFGSDAFEDSFSLVVASFGMSKAAQTALANADQQFPYVAKDDILPAPTIRFRVDELVAAHDLRALTFLHGRLAASGATVQIRQAADIVQPFDMSFAAFGLGGSQKAKQLLAQLDRYKIGVATTKGGWIDLCRGPEKAALAQPAEGKAIGYIVRLHPQQFPRRTWILCAGPGPDGTAAAACYLSKHYKKINELRADDGKRLGKRQCVIIVRATVGFDESAIADAPIVLA